MEQVVEFEWWDKKWKNYQEWFTEIALPTVLPLVKDGIVIFAGVYTGEDFELFKQNLPNCDFIGIDAVNYSKSDIIISDVREFLDSYNEDISMMWDGIGPWPWSMESKTACFEYAKNKLITGGLYYTHTHSKKDNPIIFKSDEFKVLDNKFVLMEKK
jgi:hypothetical protein